MNRVMRIMLFVFLGLGAFMLFGTAAIKYMIIIGITAVIALIMENTRTLGLLIGAGAGIAFAAFIFLGISLPFMDMFTYIALIACAVILFLS